jgi:hypothetical protein
MSGNGYVWPFVDPHWKNHLDTQGSRDMGYLNTFIKSIQWWNLGPSGLNGMRELITSGSGTDSDQDYIAAAATPDGTLLVAYVPPANPGNFTVNTTGMGTVVEGSWYDPTSGTYSKVSDTPFNNTGTRKFTTPGQNSTGKPDWVLVLIQRQK